MKIYTAVIPDHAEIRLEEIVPFARAEEIASCKSEALRVQKFFVWKLLECALREEYSLTLDRADLIRKEKWTSGKCFFSLSHTARAAAVAVSDRPVGIDLEEIARFRTKNADRIARRILTAEELCEYEGTESERRAELLAFFFTRKESVFKREGKSLFVATAGNSASARIKLGGADYALSSSPAFGSAPKIAVYKGNRYQTEI